MQMSNNGNGPSMADLGMAIAREFGGISFDLKNGTTTSTAPAPTPAVATPAEVARPKVDDPAKPFAGVNADWSAQGREARGEAPASAPDSFEAKIAALEAEVAAHVAATGKANREAKKASKALADEQERNRLTLKALNKAGKKKKK